MGGIFNHLSELDHLYHVYFNIYSGLSLCFHARFARGAQKKKKKRRDAETIAADRRLATDLCAAQISF